MSETKTVHPTGWGVVGNIAPLEVSEPDTGDVFTANNCTLTVESAVIVDGVLIKPVKSTTDF